MIAEFFRNRETFLIIELVVAFFHIAGCVLIVKALLIARTSQSAIGWVLGLFFLPYITVPLFLVFGQSKFSGYTLSGSGKSTALDNYRKEVLKALKPFETPLGERYGDLRRMLNRLVGFPPVGGNETELLVDGQQTFDAVFEAIDQAQKFLVIQFYIIHDDGLGQRLKEKLIAARQRGVAVYVLYDGVGSKKLPQTYSEELRRAGAEVSAFVTNREWGVRFQINFRNHRKLVIADGHIGFTGGLNVGDEYMGKSAFFGPWRDTHIRVRGPAVAAMQLGFAEDWHYATGKLPDLPIVPELAGSKRGFYFWSGPADSVEICPAIYLEMIRTAQQRLWIASPYFVPDIALRLALQHAALRGVDVRIILPGMADHKLPYLSSFTFYPFMRKAGIRLYRMKHGFMHQKVLLIDNELAMVGSVNLDSRSFMLNFESAMVVQSHKFALKMEEMLLADMAASREEDLECYEKGKLLFRLKVRAASLMAPEQ
ncbi:MAG: cardiolipin synthase [Chthoniobacterales bacterium]